MSSCKLGSSEKIIVLDVILKHKENKKLLRMALDTGASFVLVPWDVVDLLEIKPELSQRRIDIITASGIEKTPVVAVDSITVLAKEAKNVDLIIHDLPENSHISGLLGLSFLKNFKLVIDFKNLVLELD